MKLFRIFLYVRINLITRKLLHDYHLSDIVQEEQLHGTNLEQALNSVASGEPSEGALGAEMSETSLNEAQNRRQLVLGHHVLDFWTNICICQSLLVEEGLGVYQVSTCTKH